MNELKDYLNSNREITITIDLNELVDRAIKYWDYISELVEKKSSRKLLVPCNSINKNDLNDISISLVWSTSNSFLTVEIYQDYDFVRYDHWDDIKIPDWCHNDHRIGTELDSWVLDTLLLFTKDK